jgi:hypothetical protein
MGEIPPYAISYHAAKAGVKNAQVEALLKGAGAGAEDEGGDGSRGSALSSLVSRMKEWMLGFIKSHGFWGILLLAAYPNAAFDLCGVCCGAFQMPFWEFFGATLVGKAGIKVGLKVCCLHCLPETLLVGVASSSEKPFGQPPPSLPLRLSLSHFPSHRLWVRPPSSWPCSGSRAARQCLPPWSVYQSFLAASHSQASVLQPESLQSVPFTVVSMLPLLTSKPGWPGGLLHRFPTLGGSS